MLPRAGELRVPLFEPPDQQVERLLGSVVVVGHAKTELQDAAAKILGDFRTGSAIVVSADLGL